MVVLVEFEICKVNSNYDVYSNTRASSKRYSETVTNQTSHKGCDMSIAESIRENELELVDLRRYSHNCSCCTYLGQWREYDLYFCEHCCIVPSVVARWGDDRPDYVSGLDRVTQSVTPHLREAKRRAEAMGLL